uniref:Uncharacterized protein n=1 Tax=Trieres chinensis TaxID=1514140 RepID=A0A7S1ZT81_TRICV|mmetsp:Transcript_32582/g.66601  ORF Transcript_32582/g.66601 Transcript_32582/m.66601 type:complete len:313 (+) Transcript_32582:62-1000(+)
MSSNAVVYRYARAVFLLWAFQSLVCGLVTTCRKAKNNGRNVPSRRTFLKEMILVGTAVIPATSQALDGEIKPFAPPGALVPAARCKLWVDRAFSLSSTLPSVTDEKARYNALLELDELLTNRPKLFVSERQKKRADGSLAQLTNGISGANKDQYRRNRADLSMSDRLAAMLNQADVERQWGMLKFQEGKLEESNELRAAFNFYTSQLEFTDSYVLTASKEDKKRMIRDDSLPSLTAVITSDLDLRDLYRNQFLTAIEDAKAEVSYQARQSSDSLDITDTVELMKQAHTACTEWFELIPKQDVREALDFVSKE